MGVIWVARWVYRPTYSSGLKMEGLARDIFFLWAIHEMVVVVHFLNQQFYVMGRYGEGISSDKVDIMRPKWGFFGANMMGPGHA